MTSSNRPVWLRRILRTIAFIAVVVLIIRRLVPTPGITTRVDGPPPASAAGVVVFLHGKGGGLGTGARIVSALREVGLPADIAIVRVEGPYHTWFGQQWGDMDAEQADSRQRIRARLRELLGDHGPPPERVVIAGFSQGAGVALDVAVEEPRIGGVASFSPCRSILRAELPKRAGLRFFLAHGRADTACPVEESRSLAGVLEEAHRPVRYVEFDGPHTIPMDVVRGLATFAVDGEAAAPVASPGE